MRTERGVILVVYKRPGRSSRYAVLKRSKNWEGWELPKGHLEDGDYEETVKLELREETGIEEEEIQEIERIDHTVEWSFEDDEEKVEKAYRAYIVKVDSSALIDVDSNPHDEHEKGHFFNFSDARTLLTYDDQEKLLEKAHEDIVQDR